MVYTIYNKAKEGKYHSDLGKEKKLRYEEKIDAATQTANDKTGKAERMAEIISEKIEASKEEEELKEVLEMEWPEEVFSKVKLHNLKKQEKNKAQVHIFEKNFDNGTMKKITVQAKSLKPGKHPNLQITRHNRGIRRRRKNNKKHNKMLIVAIAPEGNP